MCNLYSALLSEWQLRAKYKKAHLLPPPYTIPMPTMIRQLSASCDCQGNAECLSKVESPARP